MSSVYDFTVQDMQGNDVHLADYQGKVLLIVNTATECGFTPTYADLQKLYQDLGDQDFEILDFPCNQFGNQAPGTAQEIHTFCTGRFGVTFPQFAKVEVNGEHEHPLFTWLKKEQGFAGFDPNHKLTPILTKMFDEDDPHWKQSADIKWNFTKFLLDKNGQVVARFEPTADIATVVRPAVEKLL
ncbi:glutathione peroxidase [Collinsella sp. AGMB00827]|uniref:Glutathione peroxidase n=1 Tax=Collinsella ureilytica TaxID=2869515 RepID=A0ABS7MKC4_9ACTN|nr:glutathione peroxidase [Collinsella urealyticum]MBY4797820.1 glutathione peroxidase [Collinsella urealyticum]